MSSAEPRPFVPASLGPDVRPPGVLACGLLLVSIRLGLKLLGYRRVRAIVDRFAGRGGHRAGVTHEALMPTARAVSVAAAFVPARAECLEQSLALYVLFRRRGIPVELRLGVQPYPFSAHAWVEHEGQPVHEVAENLVRFEHLRPGG